MRKIVTMTAVAALALAGTGCTELTNLYDAVTGATVTPATVQIEVNAFDAIEATATNYLKLPACGAGAPSICRSAAAVNVIVPAIRSGRAARNTLEQSLVVGSTAPIPVASYQALVSDVALLKQVLAEYGVQ